MDELTNIEWINAKQRFIPTPRFEPPIDEPISKIVGKKIYATDPRLLKLIIKWKGSKPQNSMEPDNFLYDKNKVEELKKALSGEL